MARRVAAVEGGVGRRGAVVLPVALEHSQAARAVARAHEHIEARRIAARDLLPW
ncbi:MAG: hypothetical protein OXH52_22055 [Gammaproteobacteria bacterium]|nr:hypothetical protein [Gammaproteobacteria bacterium]